MRPSPLLLGLLALWSLLAAIIAAGRLAGSDVTTLSFAWSLSGIALIIATLIDALRPGQTGTVRATRAMPGSLALGVACPVSLHLHNPLTRNLSLVLSEPPSPALAFDGIPVTLKLPAGANREIRYRLTPIRRGDNAIGPLVARITSRWGLIQHRVTLGDTTPVKVYPNFAPIARIADLGVEQHVRQLGIHLTQRRGGGLEFRQLREFIEGDELRQVDWKATARHRKPISREYQDERDQDIFFLLDCGRRLRHKDGELSHFDHALNAVLLTAYIAIRQGDATGFFSFAGDERWLPPVKGKGAINVLTNQLYDLESTRENSDYLKVAEAFASRHRKRSLVIIISNVREEDDSDLVAAARMLSKRHLVMVASLRENFLDNTLSEPVQEFEDALMYAGTRQYLSERQQVLRHLTASGVIVVDTPPQHLHIKLVNEYFRMKRSHRL